MGHRTKLILRVTVVGALGGTLLCASARADSEADFPGAAQLQERIQRTAAQILPTVVAVTMSGRSPLTAQKRHLPAASGVIITADGLVLSQYHVSHQADPADPTKDATPGTKMTVILHDGTRSEAERLGGDAVLDLSLLKLTGPGPYPHAPLSDWADVTAGETVLKAGHPRGYFGGQPPLLRRGRVLWSGEGMFVADAPLDGGDSGGPYFDADGRLIGIVFSSWLPASVAGNGTAYTRGVIPQSAHALSQLRGRIEPMARGEVRRPSPDVEFAVRQMQVRAAKIPALTADRWSQGATTLASYREVVSVAKSGVVAILDGDSAVVLGTVVAAEGLVVTVASRVPHDARCRLPDGRLVQAKVVGVHPAFDLALLRLPAAGLEAVGWAEANPAVGSIVVAAGADDLPLAVGIVSAGRRDLPGPHPATVTRPQRQPATLPEVIGSAVQGRGYWVEFAEGEAVRAGIEPGDVILSIGGMAVRSHQELARCVRGRAAGDRLPVRLLRSGRHVELRLTLRARSVIGFTNREAGYPTVFEHDLPLDAAECGSPVVGLDGKAVGLTVARLGGSGCMAVPADVVQRLLPELKAGRPLAALPPIKAPPADGANTGGPIGNPSPSAGAPTKLTIEALRQGLADWRDRFRSLSVEYDVVSEAHVEPLQLLAWNMHSIRDYQERHQVAFDGRKRFQEIQGPSVMPFYAPLDLVVPDPKAPPEVKRAVEDARTLAVSQGKEDVDRLFAGIVGQPELSRLIYDGETCVRWSQGARKMMKVPAPRLSIFSTYLANLGLQPPDANPGERPTAQQAFWFPASLDLYETLRVLPVEQEIDGVACVILEAELNRELEGRGVRIQDRIWFASNLGFSPVRWEQREDGVLTGVRENSDFDEFALNCWLPWEATWTLYAPKWAAERYRNQPAYGFNMRLRKARVNEVPQALFQTVEQ